MCARGKRDNPLFKAFVEAGKQAGFELTDDYNGDKQEGFGADGADDPQGSPLVGGQCLSAPGDEAPERDSWSACFAPRVVIENGRAIGVEIERGGQVKSIGANREVIVAASSINSPKILMLSGIGPAAHLEEHGIQVVADRPGVGAKPAGPYGALYPAGVHPADHALFKAATCSGKALIGAAMAVLQERAWAPPTSSKAAAFMRSKPGVKYPDIQYPLPARRDPL